MAEHGLGEIIRRLFLKGEEFRQSHDSQRSEGARHIEDEESTYQACIN